MSRTLRSVTALPLLLAAAPAVAHPGHITDTVAGHDHWVAGIALGIAAGVAIIGAIKSIKGSKAAQESENEAAESDASSDADPQEA
ncbi:DUF6732 family protein [Celeribacter sp.]|uniref:DUF6732 family protein n=1 Tax=Celeribacter sp. TaxID=1890673 RepID=UPI003A8CD00E